MAASAGTWHPRRRGQYALPPAQDAVVRDRYSRSPADRIWSDAHSRLLAAGMPQVWGHSPLSAEAIEVEPEQLSPWLLKSLQESERSMGFGESYNDQDFLPALHLSAAWQAPSLAATVAGNRKQEQPMDDDQSDNAEDRLYEALQTLRANNALLSQGLGAMEMSLHELEVTQVRLMAEIQRMRSAKKEEPSQSAETKQPRCVLCGHAQASGSSGHFEGANTERIPSPTFWEPQEGASFNKTGLDKPESRKLARSCKQAQEDAAVIG